LKNEFKRREKVSALEKRLTQTKKEYRKTMPTPTPYFYGGAQGERDNMEDIELVADDKESGWQLFAVCDGHAGKSVVNEMKKRLPSALFDPLRKAYLDNKKSPLLSVREAKTLVTTAIVNLDRTLFEVIKGRGRGSGCTLVAALFHPGTRQLIFMNVGDSRVVYQPNESDDSKAGGQLIETRDHKPNDAKEMLRVEAAGSFVKGNRVGGMLAMSRAMGDFPLKKNNSVAYDPVAGAVCAFPDVYVGKVHRSGGTMVLACDGIWDVLSSSAVIQHAKQSYDTYRTAGAGNTNTNKKLDNPAKSLVHLAYNKGSTDNMTALVVVLPPSL
jgi:serine/threonine protein phosphatase PrpC